MKILSVVVDLMRCHRRTDIAALLGQVPHLAARFGRYQDTTDSAVMLSVLYHFKTDVHLKNL
jgi:hypothetical protein